MRRQPVLKRLMFLLLAGIVLAGCGGSATSGNNNGSTPGPVAKVTLSSATATLAVGATKQFSASVADASGNAITGATLTWASSATSVATVSASGLVTAVAVGTANITAATGGITSAAAVVTVTAPVVATITLAPATPSIAVGGAQQFTATAKDASGNTISGATFTWASSSTTVATINSSGLATGVAAGTTSITATSGGVTSAADVLTVTGPAVASVTLAPAAPSIAVGATQQFTATAKDASGNTLSGATFTWASSSTATATISSSGLATGVAAGTTNITAASGGVTSAADVLTVTQPAQVTGTAATGAPIAAATVTLKDATGASATATTASDGTFAISSAGLTPPFLLSVTPASGTPLYSVSADSNLTTTINVDPLTDLTIRSWYTAQGVAMDSAFSSPATAPAPTPAQLQPIETFVQNQVQLWLTNNGVSTTNFNLITTPFTANGAGVDKVLDETTITNGLSSATVAITDGTTTQTTSLSYATSTNTVSASTTTTSGTGASQVTSTNTSTTAVPVSSAQATALAAINAQTAALTAVFAAKGANLADTDIEPFLATDLEFQSLDQAEFAAELATYARGNTSSLTATQIHSLDTSAGTASAHVVFQLGQSQLSADMNFSNASGAWLMTGDGRVAELDLDSEYDVQQLGTQLSGDQTLNADVKATTGLVTAATVSGSAFGSSASLQQQAQQQQTYAPTPSGTLVVTRDNFNTGVNVSALAAGTPVTFQLTTTSGPVSYTLQTNAATSEGLAFTSVTSSDLSAVNLGAANSYSWTLPKTFPVASLDLKEDAYNGDPASPSTTDCRQEAQLTSPTATTGSVTVPATCSGTIVTVVISLGATGLNGEYSQVQATFGQNFNSGGPGGGSTVANVVVSPSNPATLAAGSTLQLAAAATDASGHAVSGASIAWASSNTAVAAVSSSGVVTGLTAGTTNITASSGGVTSASVAITVSAPVSATYSIVGTVSLNSACGSGAAAPGVTISINTTPAQQVTTDSNGYFTFSGLANGTYTLTPAITGPSAVFYPATQVVTINGASNTSASFAASLGYTVSGTVAYSGSAPGQVYLTLSDNNCNGNNSPGTSIAGPGPFTIQGVAPGSYTLNAWRDTLGAGASNAADPSGTATVPVAFSDATGASVTLTDPGAVTLSTAPKLHGVAGMNNGVLVQYSPIADSNGNEQATSYTLEWSTSSSFSPVAGSHTFAASGTGGSNIWFLNSAIAGSLTDGSVYYFRLYGTAGSSNSPDSTSVVGPVTIGAPTGGNTVSGTVTFSGTATGPMYTGFYDTNSGAFYGQYIPNPVSPQVYSIQVPTGTSYFQVAVVDQHNSGVISTGDFTNVPRGSNPTGVPITGPATGMNLSLSGAGSNASVITSNYQVTTSGGSSQSYSLTFSVVPGTKLPVAVELTGGPNVVAPLDLAVCGSCGAPFQYTPNLNGTAPTAGDSYALKVTYSDTTSETLNAAVGAVLTAFPTNLATSGTTTPTFTWTDPSNASNYTYQFQLFGTNTGTIWQIPGNNSNANGFGSSITSITWGTDPTGGGSTPSVSALTSGLTYSWLIQVQDTNGNTATQLVTFMP